MEYLQLILMAVLQGVTEFLPVSSSGHMAFLNALYVRVGWNPIEEQVTVEILLHLASLLAIMCYYWRPIHRMIIGNDNHLLKLILVGTVPVGIVGVLAKVFFETEFDALLQSVPLTGTMMIVTAFLLLLAHRLSAIHPRFMHMHKLRRNLKTLSYLRAFGIGCVQACAILPGLSRSGSTITAGLCTGLKRQDAGTFSFLLAIPAIGAAGLVEILHLFKEETAENIEFLPLFVAFVVCFIVSLCSLSLLVRLLRTRSIGWFAAYLIPMGILLLCM